MTENVRPIDVRPIDGLGSARAPARGRFRLFALGGLGQDAGSPLTTIGLVDAGRDRSLQISLAPTRRRTLGWSRDALLQTTRACEGGECWPLVDGGRARLDLGDADSRPHVPLVNDLLLPLRAAGPDLATALILLRAEAEHVVALPTDGRTVRLSTSVEGQVVRVDVHDGLLRTHVFVAPADATDHDLLPEMWPPLTEDVTRGNGQEYARSMPPLWRAAADLLREAVRRP